MDLKSALLKIIDEEGLKEVILVEVMDGMLKPKLEEFAKDSSNPYDDALVAMLYPILREGVKAGLDKLQEAAESP